MERQTGRVVNPTATTAFFQSIRLLQNAQSLQEPYRQHGWTYAAIRALASNVAQVPWRILTGDPDNPTVVTEGPWVDLFDHVNPHMEARSQLWEAVVIWLSHSGEVAVFKGGHGTEDKLDPGEVPRELWPVNGKSLEPKMNERTKLVDYWEGRDDTGGLLKILPRRLVRVKYYNPYFPLRGLAPLEAAEIATTSDFKAQQFNEAYFDNDATPGGILKHPKEMTDDQRKEVDRGWNDKHQGRGKRRRIGVLEGGLEWIPTGDSLRDMEFGALRNMNRQEILGVFKVPESEVSLMANLNFATALSSDRGFWTKTLIPIMRLIEDSLWVQLFDVQKVNALRRKVNRRWDRYLQAYHQRLDHLPAPDEDEPINPILDPERPSGVGRIGARGQFWGEFDLTAIEALRQNLDLKLTSAQRMMQMGYTLNQTNERLQLGMEDVPWGDIPFASAGSVPLAQLFLPGEGGGLPPEVGGPNGDTPAPTLPEPGDPPQPDNEEPTAVGEGSAIVVNKKNGNGAGVDPKIIAVTQRAFAQLHARQSPKAKTLWLQTMKNVNLKFEPRFRNKYRRYLVQLRSVQLARLLAVSKGELPDDEPRAGAIQWDGVDITRKASAFRLDPSDLEDILFNEDRSKKKIKTQHHPVYLRVSDATGDQVTAELGGNFAFDITDPAMAEVIANREEILAQVPVRLRRRLARSLESGLRNDETIGELADRIRAEFNVFGGARSLTIARTEVASTQSETRNEAFIAEGIEEHRWVTARDEAVRPSHARQDGTKRTIGQPFPNGLTFPAQAGGPPGEIINCRCIAISVR